MARHRRHLCRLRRQAPPYFRHVPDIGNLIPVALSDAVQGWADAEDVVA